MNDQSATGRRARTSSAVGLAVTCDDALAVWASGHNAVVVSTDHEFGQRRTHNAIGWHVWLHSADGGSQQRLGTYLSEVVARLEACATGPSGSEDGITSSSDWR